jgi:hypothetical protein
VGFLGAIVGVSPHCFRDPTAACPGENGLIFNILSVAAHTTTTNDCAPRKLKAMRDRDRAGEFEAHPDGAPPKSRKPAISEQIFTGAWGAYCEGGSQFYSLAGGRMADRPAGTLRNVCECLPDRCTHRRRDRSLDDAARLSNERGPSMNMHGRM